MNLYYESINQIKDAESFHNLFNTKSLSKIKNYMLQNY
jgi:hypothetical protein